MTAPNYGEIADRIEARNSHRFTDGPAILALLGYEARPHARWGLACRENGETHFQSAPRFDSADDFDLWVLGKREASLNDIGRNEDNDEHYVSYDEPTYGNDYGYSRTLGAAMWAAFVRTVGRVGVPE